MGLDFSHFGPFEKLISQIDPWKNLSQKWSFLGRQSGWRRRPIFFFFYLFDIFFTFRDTQKATIEKMNSNGHNMWPVEFFLSSPLSELVQRREMCNFFIFILFFDIFSHLGTHKNQPYKK